MNPLKKKLLDSVIASVWHSVRGSVQASVGWSVYDSVRVSVGGSVVRPAGWPLREHLREKAE